MSERAVRFAENLACVRERIAAAARRSGRSSDDIKLVAVVKYVDAETSRALVDAGCFDLGESRPQALWEKADALEGLPVRWHMIGHLQRNKVRRTAPLTHLIHSGDSERLLASLSESGREAGRPIEALLEVNISGDAAKHGFAPAELAPLLPKLGELEHVRVRGLMAMASIDADADRARREFAALRLLRDDLQPQSPPGVSLDELSMGMSGDYEIAIEEGATLVRVGSALFDGVDGLDDEPVADEPSRDTRTPADSHGDDSVANGESRRRPKP